MYPFRQLTITSKSYISEDHALYVEAEFGEQIFWFAKHINSDVVELLHGNSGLSLSLFLSRNSVKVDTCIDFKAGHNLSTLRGPSTHLSTGKTPTCALYLTCAPRTHLRTFRGEKVKGESTAKQSIGWGGGNR